MHQKSKYFFTLFLLLNSLSCFNKKTLQDVVIVRVNDDQLTSQIFAERLAIRLKALDVLQIKEPQNIAKIKNEVIDEFIHESIITKWAKNKKLTVSKIELEEEVKQVLQDYPDDITFRKALVQENKTMEIWKKDIQKRVLERKVFDSLNEDIKPPTLDNLKSYYNAHKSSFIEKERVHIEQFLLPTKNEAHDIYNKLKNRQDFSRSTHTYKTNYNKLWVERGVADVFKKAFSMRKGVWGGILESPYGYHIYRVLEKKRKKQWTFDEAKDKIHEILMAQRQQAKYVSWLEKQTSRLDVFLNKKALSNIYIETIGEK